MTFLKSCKLHCQNETWWVEQRICFLPPSAIERNHHIHHQIKQVWCSKLPGCKLMPLNKCSPEKKKTQNSLIKPRAIRLKCWASQLAQWLPANAGKAKVAGLICKGRQPWIFIGRTDAEAEAPVLWPPDAKSRLIWKDPDAGKDWRWEKRGGGRGWDD